MKKILFLTPFLPFPPKSTNRFRPFNWLKYLSREYKICLVSFIESEEEKQYLQELAKYCYRVEAVLRANPCGFACRVSNLFQPQPYFLQRQFASKVMQERIVSIVNEEKFDLVYVSTLAMAQYGAGIQGVKKILDGIDCNTRNYLQQWQVCGNFKNRLLSFIDWAKMRKYEPFMFSHFNLGILGNPVDREFMLKLKKGLSIETVSYGVDLQYYSPLKEEEDFPSLSFTGDSNYAPNLDAMLYFSRQVLPLIEKKFPQVKLYICGRRVVSVLDKIAEKKKNIVITGYVDDVRPYIAKSTIFICPLRIGTGVKNKVLEAMAMAKPIVSSAIGVEGISALADKELLLANNPQEFADKVISLLGDSNLRARLAANARKAAGDRHDWEYLSNQLVRIISRLLS